MRAPTPLVSTRPADQRCLQCAFLGVRGRATTCRYNPTTLYVYTSDDGRDIPGQGWPLVYPDDFCSRWQAS